MNKHELSQRDSEKNENVIGVKISGPRDRIVVFDKADRQKDKDCEEVEFPQN